MKIKLLVSIETRGKPRSRLESRRVSLGLGLVSSKSRCMVSRSHLDSYTLVSVSVSNSRGHRDEIETSLGLGTMPTLGISGSGRDRVREMMLEDSWPGPS